MTSAWRNFKNIFRPLFTIIFRPKIVILDTDSILRVKTMHESDVLSKFIHCDVGGLVNINLRWNSSQISHCVLVHAACSS